MTRVLLAAVVLAALASGSRAEQPAVRLSVRPMAAPKPALKYQLLPEVRELNPGNPAQGYLRCFAEQRIFFFSKESSAERARYQSLPLAKLPADKLRQYGGSALRQADWAARLDTPDWQVLQRGRTEGMDLLLPELGPLQVLAAALQVRFRAEVAGRHFDDAVRTAKTMFALARHLGEHSTGAANRAGLSVAQLALDTLEEMVQQPGCPNLYWALTDLPCPLVDLRKGFQGDLALVAADLNLLRVDPMTEAQLERFVSRLSGAMGFAREQEGRAPRSLRAALSARVKDPKRVRAARGRLVEAGCAEERARQLTPLQVILLDEKREYEVRRDEALKVLALAPWQMEALLDRRDSRLGCPQTSARQASRLSLREPDRGPGHGGDGLFADFLPPVLKARRAQARLEQRVGLLRHIEALRLYAAGHEGKLPERLADVAVPLPTDPFTGKPFGYQVEAATAHLRGSPPRDEEKDAGYNVHFEVTIRK